MALVHSIPTPVAKAFRLAAAAALLTSSLMVVLAPRAEAAPLQGISLEMDDARPGQEDVTHTYEFSLANTDDIVKGIKIEYCTTPSGACNAPAGMDVSGTSDPAVGGDTAGWAVATTGTNVVTLTDDTGHDPDGGNAADISVILDAITNPGTTNQSNVTVFFVRITTYDDDTTLDDTTDLDKGVVASAVVPAIAATASQDAILEFVVNPVDADETVDDTEDNTKDTTGESSATGLPFGLFQPLGTNSPSSRALAQGVEVSTNSVNGYTLSLTGGSDIEGTPYAMTRVGSDAPGAFERIGMVNNNDANWTELNPGASIGFGVMARDGDAPVAFGAEEDRKYHGLHPTTPLTVATKATPVSGVETTVVFRVQVESTLAAGDYEGSVQYSLLPNF